MGCAAVNDVIHTAVASGDTGDTASVPAAESAKMTGDVINEDTEFDISIESKVKPEIIDTRFDFILFFY